MTDQTVSSSMPGVPASWQGAAERVYRIEGADGASVAYACPEIGGNVFAYAVKAGDGWRQVFDVGTPTELRDTPSRYGLPVLFPFPGSMRGGQYQWLGKTYTVPPTYPTGSDPDGADIVIHGFAHIRPWSFVSQTDDTIVMEFLTPDALDPARAASYPFKVRVRHEVKIAADGLTSTMTATNEGAEPAPVAFGLHPYFGPGVLGPDRSQVQVELPGASVRLRDPGPPPAMNGARGPAPEGPVSVVPNPERMHASRTDFPPDAVARLINLPPIDGRSGWTVELWMDPGYQDLLMFAPPVQPSISIEPQTHMPGLASLPEGHPAGLQPLAPGASLVAVARVRLVPPASEGA
ncbi:MAG: aldose 1-epimerase [Chloroflexota bacterium]